MDLRFLSMSQIAEVTGLDRRTIKARLAGAKPYKIVGKAHIYDCHEAIPLVMHSGNLEEQMAEESLLLERARREKAQMDVAKMRGEQVDIETVATIVEKEYSRVRAQLLAISNKVCRDLVTMTDPRLIKDFMDDSINECLTELSADEDFKNKEIPKPTTDDEVSDERDSTDSGESGACR